MLLQRACQCKTGWLAAGLNSGNALVLYKPNKHMLFTWFCTRLCNMTLVLACVLVSPHV